MPTISIRLTRTGRFATGSALHGVVEGSGAVQGGRDTAIESLRATTPRVSGRMAGSWEAQGSAGAWQGSTFIGAAVNTAPYARRVDLTSKRNKGWVARSLSAAKAQGIASMKARSGSITHQLWQQGQGQGGR